MVASLRAPARRAASPSVVIGSHIVDFLARNVRLIVEVDGDIYHGTRISADRRRDQKLIRAGYTVLRIPASVVEQDLPAAVGLVAQALLRATTR